MSNTTNDPEQKYGEREPMLRDKSIESYARNASEKHVSATIMDNHFVLSLSDAFKAAECVGENVRAHYEALITDGTLIRRDELLIELMARKQAADMAFSERADERHSVVKVCIQNIIDHINKKP